jgi:glycerol-3-phosphate O-acyltransferase
MDQVLSGEGIPSPVKEQFIELATSYLTAIEGSAASAAVLDSAKERVKLLHSETRRQALSPYQFAPYHERVLTPTNFYQIGVEFVRPLTDLANSKVLGIESLRKMRAEIKKGENVILLGNHQSEFDPQVLSLLLEREGFADLGEMSIFVAGHRVVTDPVAIPFSLGRNLLCIHSKRRIDDEPDKKEERLLHNKRTMKLMSELLAAGGCLIYVAPSGGRDRPNERGEPVLAPFDPSSLEMFFLMAKQAKTVTHFYPLSLSTYYLLPPPKQVIKGLGESRRVSYTPLHLCFGDKLDMENYPGSDLEDKKERRKARCKHIYQIVKMGYGRLV